MRGIVGWRLHYIVILHQTTTGRRGKKVCAKLHYIVILHQTTTINYEAIKTGGCIISLFYIKPQQDALREVYIAGCIISLFYIKPQQSSNVQGRPCSCIISLFYIKPQRCLLCLFFLNVALYRYSTSNHNLLWLLLITALVALYRYSTSNHNTSVHWHSSSWLHYIVILHQTTTLVLVKVTVSKLHYIVILHQTTTGAIWECKQLKLHYIVILHQTTTYYKELNGVKCCIISLFYIKPQPRSYNA